MTILTGERVRLRPWSAGDAARLLDIHSRPAVVRWLDDDFENPRLLQSLTEAEARIARYNAVFDKPPQGVWAIVPSESQEDIRSAPPVGAVLLKTVPNDERGELEIGWWLHPDSQRRGYATAAAHVVLRHAFEGGADEVYALMYPTNERSAGVARRLGFSDLGIVSRWYPGESHLFRITAHGWANPGPGVHVVCI